MKDFILENWRLFLEAAICICSFVFCLVRKKPVKIVDSIQQLILRLLPGLINAAEMTTLKGEDKLKFVIERLVLVLKDFDYGDEVINQYLPFAKDQVEVILSTPTKRK